jgi:hypothetical protein
MERKEFAPVTFKEQLKPIALHAIGNYRYTDTDMLRLEQKVEYYKALEKKELEEIGDSAVTYENIERRFLASLVLSDCPFGAIVGMLKYFPRVIGIASVQSSTIRGVEIHATESIEKMLYWIKLVYISARRMRENLGMKMYEVLAYFEEIGKLGHKPHYVQTAHYRGLLDKPLPLDCIEEQADNSKPLNKTELKLLFLNFFEKLSKKKKAFILSDIKKIKLLSCDEFNLYCATALVKVRYNRLGREFAQFLEIEPKKISASELLLTISYFLS